MQLYATKKQKVFLVDEITKQKWFVYVPSTDDLVAQPHELTPTQHISICVATKDFRALDSLVNTTSLMYTHTHAS